VVSVISFFGGVPDQISAAPHPRSTLVGRDRERAEVRALLLRDDVPLVTLTGPGGVGKTRLALQVLAESSGELGERVVFIPLSTLRDPSLVLPEIAQSLGLVASSGRSPRAGLEKYLGDRDVLLVLDNFEQVVSAASELAELLAHCPRLTLLVTSRETLRIEGEHDYPVHPLSLPKGSATIEELRTAEATQLFVLRARAANAEFVLDHDSASAISQICIRLDGLPLAIELAAARVKILTPQAILNRLVDRLTLLSRDGRDVPERLRSMRDAVAWSYDLLPDDEQLVFRRLSVFAGGCTFETATSVLGHVETNQPISEPRLFDAMASLVEKSLLDRIDDSTGETRFRMLETARAFALEQSKSHGEADAMLSALAAWLIEMTAGAFEDPFGARPGYWSRFFDSEMDNARSALEWIMQSGKVGAASGLLLAISRHCHIRANYAEGWNWCERGLAQLDPRADSEARSRLLLAGSWQLLFDGKQEEAEALVRSGLTLALETGDDYAVLRCRQVLGVILESRGSYNEAKELFLLALEDRGTGNINNWYAFALNNLGHTEFELGNIEEAASLFAQADEIFVRGGIGLGHSQALLNLAKVARARGEMRKAEELFVESLENHWELRDKRGMAGCLRGLGSIYVRSKRFPEAARAFGTAEALREESGTPLHQNNARFDAAVARARNELGPDRFEREWRLGRSAPIETAVRDAIESNRHQKNATSDAVLTAREIEVLRHVSAGRSNRQIGEALFISERTAQTHVQHILTKLDVGTRAAAAARASALGIVDPI
jgi:non-specific serine/threonine protein kinase